MRLKILFGIFILFLLFVISFVSAEGLTPGYRSIPLTNYIRNIGDYPDYVFISTGRFGPGTCSVEIIESNGEIADYYQFCVVSVYAIPRNMFNEGEFLDMSSREMKKFLKQDEVIEALRDLETDTLVPDSSSQKSAVLYYTIDLEEIQNSPDEFFTKNNFLFYFYVLFGLTVIVLGYLFIHMIIKRKRS